ncbi:testis-specific serine/threonine-protein kinase 4-like [Centruroides sculpturatus]|uniref:testis-specific serine/threonine-protein kinase 4-like n=1 Tax=Centruroides sculpturatus TaxID=218467 RepID=UPI000C6D035E|nr:testis-specific serine/threonine-protein kinase 4-like [Centruroides sculpturatus]XP_023214740.1 testis-specific serine/threonine-protein kinase 4-like [Centruroides sculpturatus]
MDNNKKTDFSNFLKDRGYTLSNSVGRGSFADVRLAFSSLNRKKIAVKIMSREKVPKEFLNRFLPREIEIVKRIKHRNIVSFIECVDMNDTIYIFMEFVENGTLLQLLEKKRFIEEEMACKYFHNLIDGIAYLHKNGIVHRDIKCENLLIDRFNIIKITDFGFARHSLPNYLIGENENKDRDLILSTTFCGSLAYASPEILKGLPYEPHMSDIWSVGIVLYAMVCGRLPCQSDDYKTILKEVTTKIHFPVNPLISKLCKELIRAILSPLESRIYIPQIMANQWYKYQFPCLSKKITRKKTLISKHSNDLQNMWPNFRNILKNFNLKSQPKEKSLDILIKNKMEMENVDQNLIFKNLEALGKYFLSNECIDDKINEILDENHPRNSTVSSIKDDKSHSKIHENSHSLASEAMDDDDKNERNSQKIKDEFKNLKTTNDSFNLTQKKFNEDFLKDEVAINVKELEIQSSSYLVEDSSTEIKDLSSFKFYKKDDKVIQYNEERLIRECNISDEERNIKEVEKQQCDFALSKNKSK